MVHEGRQILRNIQRVARLFVTKALFTAFLLVTIALPTGVFPLLPRQFTLTSSLTIGIPAFFLALAPSSGPWRPEGFLKAIARFSLPAGLATGHRHPHGLPARAPHVRRHAHRGAHRDRRDRPHRRSRRRDGARGRARQAAAVRRRASAR